MNGDPDLLAHTWDRLLSPLCTCKRYRYSSEIQGTSPWISKDDGAYHPWHHNKRAYLTYLQYDAEPFGDLVRGVNMGKPTDNDYTLASTLGSVGDL